MYKNKILYVILSVLVLNSCMGSIFEKQENQVPLLPTAAPGESSNIYTTTAADKPKASPSPTPKPHKFYGHTWKMSGSTIFDENKNPIDLKKNPNNFMINTGKDEEGDKEYEYAFKTEKNNLFTVVMIENEKCIMNIFDTVAERESQFLYMNKEITLEHEVICDDKKPFTIDNKSPSRVMVFEMQEENEIRLSYFSKVDYDLKKIPKTLDFFYILFPETGQLALKAKQGNNRQLASIKNKYDSKLTSEMKSYVRAIKVQIKKNKVID